jgi:hypothetical protein
MERKRKTLSRTTKHRLEYRGRASSGAADAGPPYASRGAFLLVVLLLIATVIGIYARERWLAVVMLMLTDGLCVVGWVLSATFLGKLALRPLRVRSKNATTNVEHPNPFSGVPEGPRS